MPAPSRTIAPAVLAAALAAALLPAAPAHASTANDTRVDTYHVAPDGRDTTIPHCAGGGADQPFGTIAFAMRCLTPGDTLEVHGGTYTERVLPVINRGTATAPITVRAYRGERVLIRGLIRLDRPDFWTVAGLDVTNDGRPYGSGEYLVKLRDGVGWSFRNADVWGTLGDSYAAVRVESSTVESTEPRDWSLVGNCIHDTKAVHAPYQDHNVYVDVSLRSGPGRIERNLIFNAPNGSNLKLGPGGENGSGAANILVRHNTMWNAVQNVIASKGTRGVVLERNLLGRVGGKDWYPNVRGLDLDGTGNVVRSTIGSDAARLIFNDRESATGWRDGGGNAFPVDPRFDSTSRCSGFRPTAPAAQGYGHWLPPEPQPRGISQACPPAMTDRSFSDVADDHPHRATISCVVERGVASGTSDTTFAPERPVSRAQMATFLVNLIESSGTVLTPPPTDPFDDDDGDAHETNINKLANAGIVSGVGARRYEPGLKVSRAQMATFIVRAYEHVAGTRLPDGPDYFFDDRGNTHEAAINRAAAAGFVAGVSPGYYAPGAAVTRAQMATFLARVLDRLVAEGHV